MRKTLAPAAMAAAILFLASAAGAQESLGDFYGSRNLQYISGRYSPAMLPYQGGGGELFFGFNTSSQKTETSDMKYFYGVALGGGGFAWPDVGLGDFGERDMSAGYGLIQLENKMFFSTKGDFRPYVGSSVGMGTGSYWTGDSDDPDDDDPLGQLMIYGVGVEAGFHISIGRMYALTMSAGMDARAVYADNEVIGNYPAWVSVGVCKWRGPMH